MSHSSAGNRVEEPTIASLATEVKQIKAGLEGLSALVQSWMGDLGPSIKKMQEQYRKLEQDFKSLKNTQSEENLSQPGKLFHFLSYMFYNLIMYLEIETIGNENEDSSMDL